MFEQPATNEGAVLRDRGDCALRADSEHVRQLYNELRVLASAHFRRQPPGHTLQPTAIVNEAFLKLCVQDAGPRTRTHFLAVASRAMRQVLVDHARKGGRQKRGGGATPVSLDASPPPSAHRSVIDVLELNDLLERLARDDARCAAVVELRFFGGLSIAEAAAVLGVSESTVEGDWRIARAWLASRLSPHRFPPVTP
jgi:RNA polymerase sigma factor (TIGR02999 family)